MRGLNVDSAILCLNLLGHLAITTIVFVQRLGCLKMVLHLTFQSCIKEIFQYTVKCTILTKQSGVTLKLIFCLR